MNIIDLGHIKLRYELSGPKDAPILCLVHCFGSNHKYWDFHLDAFANFRILRFDVRGHGESSPLPGPCTLEDLAADVIALLDKLNIETVHLGGVSMGGMISQTVILNYPERIKSLMLINTTCEVGQDQKALWQKRSKLVLNEGVGSVADAMLERWFTVNAKVVGLPGYKYIADAFNDFQSKTFCEIGAAMCDVNTTKRLHKIDVPTLVVATPDDPGAPTEISKTIANEISKAELFWLQPARHLSSLENPNEFNERVRVFLSDRL